MFCLCVSHFRIFYYLSASQKAGDVTVKVKTDSGQYIGFTVFTYEDDVKEMVKNIVKNDTLQIKFFKEYYRELEKKNLPSDGRKTEALGILHVPHLVKSKIKFSPVSGIFAPYWHLISQVFNFVSYAFSVKKKKIAKLNTHLENSNHSKKKMTNL